MMESIKSGLLVIILIYAIIITVLYWTEYTNKQQYMKDKSVTLNNKEKELSKRENEIVDKEVCYRELTKLQTIQNSVLSLLNSSKINIDIPVSSQHIKTHVVPEEELPKAESENSLITMLAGIIN